MEIAQRQLSDTQLEAFYIDDFAERQAASFCKLVPAMPRDREIVDIGGGIGHFARLVNTATGVAVRVVDSDRNAVETCRQLNPAGVEVEVGDALAPRMTGREGVVTFNLILHHLVGADAAATRKMQAGAVAVWTGRTDYVFVNEYVYDSLLGDVSGWLIYTITSSKVLSALCAFIARFAPSLRANTFGVGVRFRSDASWRKIFSETGYEVAGYIRGFEELTTTRRVLLIKSLRKDSYLLRPVKAV